MPVLKKKIELNDGRKIWVRQASGMQKLRIENIQAKVFRKFKHYGDPTEWTDEQNEEFVTALDEAGGGVSTQMADWIPDCILDDDIDVDTLTSGELRTLLAFVRGDDPEGAVPLGNSSE